LLPLLSVRCCARPRPLPPFPTRRSSDLSRAGAFAPLALPLRKALQEPRIGGGKAFVEADAVPPAHGVEFRTVGQLARRAVGLVGDRKSTRLNSSHVKISYAVFCL